MQIIAQIITWFKHVFYKMMSSSSDIVLWTEIKSRTKTKSPALAIPTIFTLSASQITVFWVIGVLVVYVGYLAFQSLDLLYLILAAILISVAMESIIIKGEKWMGRGVSVALSYLLLIIFVLMGFVLILPFVLQQLSVILAIIIENFYHMGQEISVLWLSGYINSLSWMPSLIKSYILNMLDNDTMHIQSTLMNNISTLVSTGTDYAKNLWGLAVGFIGSLFSVLGEIWLVLTVAILFSLEKESIVSFFVGYISRDSENNAYLSHKINVFYRKMGIWLNAQLGLCLYIAILVYIVLLILSLFGIDLPNIGALALMAWFTEFIPYLWPIIGAVPAVIVATSIYGIEWLIIVTLAYFVVQWIENNILIPMLMNKSLGVSPLLIFLCVLIGWSVLWFIGIILAVPLAVLITMVVKKDFE